MEYSKVLLVVAVFITLVERIKVDGACYLFADAGRVSFRDNINISTRAHFKLKLKTISPSGVIYYAEGIYATDRVYDFEGVFLRDGFLHYFLFNPGEYSIGSSFGFHGKSKMQLNDGVWHTIDFFRNRKVQTIAIDGTTRTENQTGLAVDGVTQAMDKRWRSGVLIKQPIVLGEDPHLNERSGSSIGTFKGRIKDFEEVSQNHQFNQEYEIERRVTHCLDILDTV